MGDREKSWYRRKQPREQWPRFTAEVPPELAEALDAAQRKSLGINASPSNATRANLVRSALRLYLNRVDPEPEAAIDGTAEEIIDLPALEAGPAVCDWCGEQTALLGGCQNELCPSR